MGQNVCSVSCPSGTSDTRDQEISAPEKDEDLIVGDLVATAIVPGNATKLIEADQAIAESPSRTEQPIIDVSAEAASLVAKQEEQRRQEQSAEAAKAASEAEDARLKEERLKEYERLLEETKVKMQNAEIPRVRGLYGEQSVLTHRQDSVPIIALINPIAGAGAGADVLKVARRSDVFFKERFFHIIDVVKNPKRGGLLDLFRREFLKVVEEAKAKGLRARLISGGGDGTASFAIWMVFRALKADNSRADDGLKDTGNGFIWTAEEFEKYFPANAQLPLGSANDLGNILGWGQKFPGDLHCASASKRFKCLDKWISNVMDPTSQVVNFDLWGLMPPPGQETVDFKIAELTGERGRKPHFQVDGKPQLVFQTAGKPTPFFICLYFSTGFGAYMVSRFQLNRRTTPIRNRLEYIRQGAGIVLERTPPQLMFKADGIEVDCENEPYFPPRRHKGVRGMAYREVGFYNINWQAHLAHGADRAGLCTRLAHYGNCAKRPPVSFNDGHLDMYRMRFRSYLKNPGNIMQTDKKKDCSLTYSGEKGKGIFFQYDGEARFAFSPTGDPFHIYIRKALNIPVVLGPFRNRKLTEPVDNGCPVRFEFCGDGEAEQDKVRRRILKSLTDELEEEVHAKELHLRAASFTTRADLGIEDRDSNDHLASYVKHPELRDSQKS